MAIPIQVTFDCADPAQLASFWAEVLGYKLQDPPEGFDSWEAFLKSQGVPEAEWNSASALVDPEGKGPRIYFQQVKEPKVVKNRVHLDVSVSRNDEGTNPLEERKPVVNAAVERVVAKGATRLRSHEERGEYWVVMQDPEGNEFCLQ